MVEARRGGAGVPSVAFFAMLPVGHFHRLRPLISAVADRGMAAHVLTDRRFEAEVERAGGSFLDLFARYPLEAADGESAPFPCRYVSFAARYADEVIRDLERIRPSLVIYDTFAVIGRVAGAALGLPYVNVCAGHNVDPGRIATLLETLPSVEISSDCRQAVETLQERYGIRDASPFSFASALSPHLNVYCEPPAYLTEAERRVFEPVAFHGSLPPIEELAAGERDGGPSYFDGDRSMLRVYVSFGTVVWRFWPAAALEALQAISDSLARMPNVRAVIGLGGGDIEAGTIRGLIKPNVRVESYVDQWRTLEQADVFVTHHGLSSTHEAIFKRVPMISYPFFWDQPALADRCQRLGLAIPLTDSLRGEVSEADVRCAFAQLSSERESMRRNLAAAYKWELEVIANRDGVMRRILDLIPA